MADAGKIVITPKGAYSSTKTYEWLDEVSYNGNAYVALKTVTGVTPSDDGVNWRLFMSSEDVDANVLVPKFTEASTRSNIVSGENLSTMFGKIKKWFTDLKSHAFKDLVNNLTTSTTGSALDASQGKVLQDEVDGVNRNLVEQKMLGWNVPEECPIQNEVNENQFIQKVGRVDLGTFNWNLQNNLLYVITNLPMKTYSALDNQNVYCNKYTSYSWSDFQYATKGISFQNDNTVLRIKDTSYTDEKAFKNAMQGVYLYYELATPITMTIDGNEAVEKINESLVEQKMLGWNVPAECPVQNIVSNEVFTQKVGRVDLGNLDWIYSSEYKRFSTSGITDYKKKDSSTNTWVADAFLKGYSTTSGNNTAIDSYNKSIGFNGTSNIFFVKNTSYTDTTTFKNAMQGKYLYYELETEITMNVDGNEAVDRIKNDLSTHTHNYAGSDTPGGSATYALQANKDGAGNVIDATYINKTYMRNYGAGSIAFGNNMFIGIFNGDIICSSDGQEWEVNFEPNLFSLLDNDEILLGITYGNEKFVSFSNKGCSYVSSDNGNTWTKTQTIITV